MKSKNDKPQAQALRLLKSMKKRLKAKNVSDVATRLINHYITTKQIKDQTRDIDLKEDSECPFRFETGGVFHCGKSAPRTVKLRTLKICIVCLIKRAFKGKDLEVAVRASKAGVAYDKYLLIQAKRLVSGETKKHCQLSKQMHTLLSLPCVKGIKKLYGMKPTELMGCKHQECERKVKELVRVYYQEVRQR